jgi:hypothetical protein
MKDILRRLVGKQYRASSYGFRIRFNLPTGRQVNEPAKEVKIEVAGIKEDVLLKAYGASTIKDAHILLLIGTGFNTEEYAFQVGERIRRALLLTSTSLQLGVDVGMKPIKYGDNSSVIQFAEEQDILLLEDIHGLCTYPECYSNISFGEVFPPNVVIGQPLDKLQKGIERYYKLDLKLNRKLTLALELYNSSYYEASLKARFLTLIIAVEALADQKRLSNGLIQLLDELIDLTKQKISGTAADSLADRIGNLKRESISKSCSNLIESYLGKEDTKFFKDCYEVRSCLMHNGIIKDPKDFGSKVPKLDKLISKLLLSMAESTPSP